MQGLHLRCIIVCLFELQPIKCNLSAVACAFAVSCAAEGSCLRVVARLNRRQAALEPCQGQEYLDSCLSPNSVQSGRNAHYLMGSCNRASISTLLYYQRQQGQYC